MRCDLDIEKRTVVLEEGARPVGNRAETAWLLLFFTGLSAGLQHRIVRFVGIRSKICNFREMAGLSFEQ